MVVDRPVTDPAATQVRDEGLAEAVHEGPAEQDWDAAGAGVHADADLGRGPAVAGEDRRFLVRANHVDRPPRSPRRIGKHQEMPVPRRRNDTPFGRRQPGLDQRAVRLQNLLDIRRVPRHGIAARHPPFERHRAHQIGEHKRGELGHGKRVRGGMNDAILCDAGGK